MLTKKFLFIIMFICLLLLPVQLGSAACTVRGTILKIVEDTGIVTVWLDIDGDGTADLILNFVGVKDWQLALLQEAFNGGYLVVLRYHKHWFWDEYKLDSVGLSKKISQIDGSITKPNGANQT